MTDATTDRIKMRCPVCGKKLSTDLDKAGRMAQCPHCGDSIRVAGAAGAADAAAHWTGRYGRLLKPSASRQALDGPDAALGWKVLFLTAAPLMLGLGILAGRALRPAAIEARKLARTKARVAEAQEELEHTRAQLAEARDKLAGMTAQVLAQERSVEPARGASPATQVAHALQRAYRSKVAVLGHKVGKSDLCEVAVVGELQNNGDALLSEVELTVTCLTAEGIPSAGKKLLLYPVSASENAMGATPPLAPGAVTSFTGSLADAPEDWAGEVKVEVTAVRFGS
jgi:DNA-directed RNA polymerase subunit RPC12/RpoP